MASPIVITDTNQRVFSLSDQYRQLLNGKIVNPSEKYTFYGNLTDGWFVCGLSFASGENTISNIQRFTFSSDTNIASLRGNNVFETREFSAVGNLTDGWIFPGLRATGTPMISNIARITYSADTNTTALRGKLPYTSNVATFHTAAGNLTDGWILYGSTTNSKTVRITYANDATTAALRGISVFSVTTYGQSTIGNTTDAWRIGGYTSGGSLPAVSYVLRLTYANDMSTVNLRGNLSSSRSNHSTAGNSTGAWIISGRNGSALVSSIQRFEYSNDTISTDIAGSLSLTDSAVKRSPTQAWISGGADAGAVPMYSTMYRYEYASGTMIRVGDLAIGTSEHAGL